jgi:hypothetical protein
MTTALADRGVDDADPALWGIITPSGDEQS